MLVETACFLRENNAFRVDKLKALPKTETQSLTLQSMKSSSLLQQEALEALRKMLSWSRGGAAQIILAQPLLQSQGELQVLPQRAFVETDRTA